MIRLFNLDIQLLSDTTIQLAVSVFVLFTILSYFLFDPVRKVLNDRQERIKSEIFSAQEDKKNASALKEQYDAKLKNVEKEAEDILSDARQKALKNEARIIDEAKEEAAAIIRRAKEEAELEKKRTMDDVKKEIISIASLMAAKVVSASIDTTIQDSLVEETLREMGESTWQS